MPLLEAAESEELFYS
uniref:Uncharacterized protein n=1 Tax=Anguilla anguilla TaxID=7936 RepID=A0A0E9SL06_ANGAN